MPRKQKSQKALSTNTEESKRIEKTNESENLPDAENDVKENDTASDSDNEEGGTTPKKTENLQTIPNICKESVENKNVKEQKAEENQKTGSALTAVAVVGAVICCVFAVGYITLGNPISRNHSYRSEEEFNEQIKAIRNNFTNQDEFYWRFLTNSGLRHLHKVHSGILDDLRPMSLLIAGHSGSSGTLDCFLKKLASAYTEAEYVTINANEFTEKVQLDEMIKKSIGDNQKVLVIKNIEKLNFDSATLFMSYADEHNDVASFPQSTLILSTQLPDTYDKNTKRHEAEEKVASFLKNTVWKGNDKNYVAALWTRVGDGTVVIRPEENNPCAE
ncbi:uncharacterized protein LOC130612313 [Hydractinia symbiolongicarpus]|uniref:uncharacterized protein LOC130612313 n=1 Tax=Hydractinia symbiolongicarpus TaxID=13093 RepID=UPI00254AB629|nr:uncharacterized protein LOC130612313 [Hydractinia symbiolongicarpus]